MPSRSHLTSALAWPGVPSKDRGERTVFDLLLELALALGEVPQHHVRRRVHGQAQLAAGVHGHRHDGAGLLVAQAVDEVPALDAPQEDLAVFGPAEQVVVAEELQAPDRAAVVDQLADFDVGGPRRERAPTSGC